MSTLYGYRYKPAGAVLPLHGLGFTDAVDKVKERRHQQGRNGAAATAELVERDGDGWRFVPMPDGGAL
ncbi:hypothetical protein [Micromonospora sp. NPDC048169]|uniref:hypothetical protein n=1 Tax=Micromonospora sp. NPDC048169 TaxID=3154711 RepID=UPI0033F879B4